MERIEIHPTGWGFRETRTGKSFTPWGCNYYDPFTGWAPKLWARFDKGRVMDQMADIAAIGGNCIRVFLTLTNLLEGPGKLRRAGFDKVLAMLDLAQRNHLRVIWSGANSWEGGPAWWPASGFSEFFIHPDILADQETIWKTLAGEMKGHPALFAYDLLNEPSVPYQASPVFNELWREWKAANAPAAPEDPPSPQPPLYLNWDWDLQRFRESLAVAYVERMSTAIRSADDTHLITIGLHQKSAPFDWYPPDPYTAFHPRQIDPFLDYISLHFYPHHTFHPNIYRDPYETPEGMRDTLIHARAAARFLYAANKPMVFEECGWYGGGAVYLSGREQPWRSQADQTTWCSNLAEATRGDACGWLFWPYRDTPTSLDPSRFSGFYTAEGEMKDWGRTFAAMAPEMTQAAPPRQTGTRTISVDHRALVTNPEAIKSFRKEYLWAFGEGDAVDFV